MRWLSLPFACAMALTWAGSLNAQATTDQETCIACHQALPEGPLNPVAGFAQDIHAQKGFGCVACHGGNGTIMGPEAMDPAQGFRRNLRHQDIPGLCGRCHADADFMRQYSPALRVDQVSEYATSVHGRRLAEFGDTLVATCASCHPAHRIRPPSDPHSSVHPLNVVATCGKCHADPNYMAPYGIPTDQVREYSTSVHARALMVGRDLAAPTCNDCHGNHGAAPPGVSWVGNTCGQCHAVMAENFRTSRHAEIFPLIGMPGCAACHQNHAVQSTSDAMLGLTEGAVCSTCHTAESEGGIQATAMRSLIDSLRTQLDSARHLLDFAENAGVEVSQAQFELEGAVSSLIASRAAVHGFRTTAVDSAVQQGLTVTQAAMTRGIGALGELRFRRTGLAVFALITVVLIVALLLKIKTLEGPRMSYIMFTREMRLPDEEQRPDRPSPRSSERP